MTHQGLQLGLVLQFSPVLCLCKGSSGGWAGELWSEQGWCSWEERGFWVSLGPQRWQKAQCSRHGWVLDLISLFLLKASLRCGFYHHIFVWVGNLLQCRNRLIRLMYSVQAESMQVALLGLDHGNRDHWTNSDWHVLKEKCNMKLLLRFVLSCHLAYFQQGRKLVLKNSASLLAFTGLLQVFFICRSMGLGSGIVIWTWRILLWFIM